MTTSFYNGITGLKSFQTGIDIWSHNISNINNIGYKENIPEFASLFSEAISTSPITSDIGMGSYTSSSAINLSQGSLISTENKLDLAIQGEGWFQVSKNGENYFTRTGSFTKDANGDIVLDDGSYLLGAMAGNLIPDGDGYKIDTNIDTTNLITTRPLSKLNLPTDILLPAVPTTQVNLSTNLDNDYAISKTAPATGTIDASALYSKDKTFLNVTTGDDFVYGLGDNPMNYNKGLLSTELCINDDPQDGNDVNFDFYVNDTHVQLTLPDGSTKSDIQNALSQELTNLGIQNEITQNGVEILDQNKIVIKSNNNLVQNSAIAKLTYNSNDEFGFNTLQDLTDDLQTLATDVSPNLQVTLNDGKIEISNSSTDTIPTTLLSTENSNDDFIKNLGNLTADLSPNSSISSEQFLSNTQSFSGDFITANSDKDTLSFTFTKQKVTNDYSLWNATIKVLDPNSNTISTKDVQLTFDNNGNLLNPKEIQINSPQDTTINLNLTAYSKINPIYAVNYGYTQNGMLSSTLKDYQIDQNGDINAIFENGHAVTIAQIPIFHFQNDQGLESIGGNLFRATDNSNKAIIYTDNNGNYIPSSKIMSGELESSNVNFSQAMTELIVTQKAFSSAAKAVTTSDQMIQRAIDMKRG